MKIAILVGSLRKESLNMIVAKHMEEKYGKDYEVKIPNLNLPLYNEDLNNDEMRPKEVNEFLETMKWADGLIFITPEYNHCISPVTKNAIDWASRNMSLKGMPAFLMGVSIGKHGTVRAQANLRLILNLLEVYTIPGHEVLIGPSEEAITNGVLTDKGTIDFIDSVFNDFIDWSENFSS